MKPPSNRSRTEYSYSSEQSLSRCSARRLTMDSSNGMDVILRNGVIEYRMIGGTMDFCSFLRSSAFHSAEVRYRLPLWPDGERRDVAVRIDCWSTASHAFLVVRVPSMPMGLWQYRGDSCSGRGYARRWHPSRMVRPSP